jgi:hypothetical protein
MIKTAIDLDLGVKGYEEPVIPIRFGIDSVKIRSQEFFDNGKSLKKREFGKFGVEVTVMALDCRIISCEIEKYGNGDPHQGHNPCACNFWRVRRWRQIKGEQMVQKPNGVVEAG